jgi:DNA repair protein RadD
MQLRDYQISVRDRVIQACEQGSRATLIWMPTGAGKGTLATEMIRTVFDAGNRAMFLVNRTEIVSDTSGRLDVIGVPHGVIMANNPRRNYSARVFVASKDTLQNRTLPPVEMLFVDEAHCSVSDGWRRLLDHYRSKGTFIVGMTATPVRLDGRGLGEIFDRMVKGPSVQDLQDMGFLVRTRVFAAPGLDLKGVTTQGGDYREKDLAIACDKPTLIGDIYDHWVKHAENRCTVVFAVNREHSEHIREQFDRNGVPAVCVDANTSSDERKRVWREMEADRIKVVCSVGIVSYGWDFPKVAVAILARPTKSLALYLQQVGRVLRPYPGKDHALILDHAGNTREHGFVHEDRDWSLNGVKSKQKEKETVESVGVVMCMRCWLAFSSDLDQCPSCGADKPKRSSKPETKDGELQEILSTEGPLALHRKLVEDRDPEKAERYKKLAELCRAAERRAWKANAPAMIFKKQFGQYPNKLQLQAARAAAAQEPEDRNNA